MFSTNNYDVIILGGGISGLFLAYKLSEADISVMLVEQTDRFGGRIYTMNQKKVSYECGAARFHSSHLKLFSLIKDLNLMDKVVELPRILKHILRGKERNYSYKTKNKLNLDELLKISIEKKKDFQKDNLYKITFFQYLISVFDYETAVFMKDSFGYDSEFLDLNADAALQMFEKDLFSDNDYHILYGGLSQIVNQIVSELEKRENVTIHKGCSLKSLNEKTITLPQGTFHFRKLICAIPPSSLERIDYFEDKDYLSSVKKIPLLRIYAKYPVKNKNVWFKNIKRTTTDNYIRHVIPIDYDSGLIMISYTDGYYTKMWEQLYSCGEDLLIQHLHKEINDLYGINPPKPEFISFHLWGEGLHVWKPGYKMNETYSKMIQPDENVPIYICGEAFSKKQGWIEGCLETCYDVLHKLDLPGIDIIRETEIKEKQDDENVEIKEDKKTYTIDEVIKQKFWIVFEINKEKRIYDVEDWVDDHPGKDEILKGVTATKDYYKDNGDISPTKLFNSIGKHKGLVDFLKMKEDVVKYIGVLE
jgi:protoporphyrinogen oxidase